MNDNTTSCSLEIQKITGTDSIELAQVFEEKVYDKIKIRTANVGWRGQRKTYNLANCKVYLYRLHA